MQEHNPNDPGGYVYQQTYYDAFGSPAVVNGEGPRFNTLEDFFPKVGGRDYVKFGADPVGETLYLHADAQGTTGIITNQLNGESQDQVYYPFGQQWVPMGGGYDVRFGSLEERDAATGFDPTPARQYTSTLGRWMTPDPAGRNAVRLDDPQTWNMYAYARNNPTTLTDPTGLCDVDSEHHNWLWCSAHALGLVETQKEQVQDARNFFKANEVFLSGKYVDPNRLSNADILKAFQTFNAEWARLASTGANPSGILGASTPGFVDLTDPQARTHILEGDEYGGGHRAGTGISGKSEFPSTWGDEKVLNEVSDVATDPASKVTRQGPDTVIEGTREGVDIRVIVRNGRILTAYPTNLPKNP